MKRTFTLQDARNLKEEFIEAHGKNAFTEFVIKQVNENSFFLEDYHRNPETTHFALAFIMASILGKSEQELNDIRDAFHEAAQLPGNGNKGTYDEEVRDRIIANVNSEIAKFDDWKAAQTPAAA